MTETENETEKQTEKDMESDKDRNGGGKVVGFIRRGTKNNKKRVVKTEVETKNPEKKFQNVNYCDGDQDRNEYGGAVRDEGGKLEGKGGKEGELENVEGEKGK